MKLIFKETFINRLENQIEYIALDSPAKARKFSPLTFYYHRVTQSFKQRTTESVIVSLWFSAPFSVYLCGVSPFLSRFSKRRQQKNLLILTKNQ